MAALLLTTSLTGCDSAASSADDTAVRPHRAEQRLGWDDIVGTWGNNDDQDYRAGEAVIP